MPPRCSTERRAAAAMRRRTGRWSASDISVTLHRFGRKRVRVLRFEWLTRLPVWTALPVSSQRRDMGHSVISGRPGRAGVKARFFARCAGGGPNHESMEKPSAAGAAKKDASL